jgi:hypothetical protein
LRRLSLLLKHPLRDYFRNQPDNDISTPKPSLKHACKIKDEDTAIMVQMRMWLFEVTAGHLDSILPRFYGMPIEEFQRDRRFRPCA